MKRFTHTPAGQSPRSGFSLAELMVVIVILGLLATVVVPKVIDKLATSQVGVAKASIISIAGAVTEYAINNAGRYPESIDVLVQPDENGKSYLDLSTTPTDPWGNPFEYQPPIGTEPFRVICYGKDGVPGGEGDDRDFDNVMIKNKEI